MTRTTEAQGLIRAASEGSPLVREGIAVPYGQIAANTDIGAEMFLPGAFAKDAQSWGTRSDGAKIPYRPKHGADPIGVTAVRDTPEGLAFTTTFFDRADAHAYLEAADAGLNGVSVEFLPVGKPSRAKGVTAHREARIVGLAGALVPAYDGARLSLRELEEYDVTEAPEPQEREATAPATTEQPEVKTREAQERETLAQIAPAGIRITRAPRVYGREAELGPRGETHTFMADAFAASMYGDSGARERQERHYAYLTEVQGQMERAGDLLIAEVPGAYPNDYVPGLLTPRILQGRPMGGFFMRMPISDARPRVFAKVTTSGTVATAADGVALTATDIATTSVTVTPAFYGTYTDISRAVFDGADPNADQIVFQDLIEAYSQASETAIKTAVEAGASASGTAITAATPYAGTLGNVVKYQSTRYKPATGAFIPSALYAVLLAQTDSTNRAFLPWLGAQNSMGTTNDGATGANLLGASVNLSWASTANVCVFARPEDMVILESPVVRFTFEQAPGGPHAIRVGVWAYLGIGARLGGLKVTAA